MTMNDWSVPESEVITGIRDLLDTGEDAVLATVIDIEGSAYRRPGAKMVISEEGTGIGSLTAGCLEDEVRTLANEVLAASQSRVETYDLMEDDVWGLGVGCNGVIDILLEPLDETYRPAVEAYERGEDIGIITVLEGDILEQGHRVYYRPDSGFSVASGEVPDWLTDSLAKPAADLAERGSADTIQLETNGGTDDGTEVFIDGITAPPELVVLGSGHDVNPVVELAKKNDFGVTVISFRGAAATNEKFPHADAVRSISPTDLREAHPFDDTTYTVVMTHNFIDDRLAVDELVRTASPYIGLMGPRKRFDEMLEDFADEGRTFSEAELDAVYTPIGLDLGGGSPYQIAHSIVAEVLAVHNDRTPQHLKARAEPIHDRINTSPAGVSSVSQSQD